jgi:hypothetical protein
MTSCYPLTLQFPAQLVALKEALPGVDVMDVVSKEPRLLWLADPGRWVCMPGRCCSESRLLHLLPQGCLYVPAGMRQLPVTDV